MPTGKPSPDLTEAQKETIRNRYTFTTVGEMAESMNAGQHKIYDFMREQGLPTFTRHFTGDRRSKEIIKPGHFNYNAVKSGKNGFSWII